MLPSDDNLHRLTVTLSAAKGLLEQAAELAKIAKTEIEAQNLVDQIRAFDHIRNTYDVLDENRKTVYNMIEAISRESIPAKMDADGVTSIRVDGVGRVSLNTRVSVSMLDKYAAMEWLRSNGHGDLIQETVNSSTLSAFSKSLLEEEGKELPDDVFKTSAMRYTSITKR